MKKYQKVNEEKLKERKNNIVKLPKKKKKGKETHQRVNEAKKLILLKLIGKSHSRL